MISAGPAAILDACPVLRPNRVTQIIPIAKFQVTDQAMRNIDRRDLPRREVLLAYQRHSVRAANCEALSLRLTWYRQPRFHLAQTTRLLSAYSNRRSSTVRTQRRYEAASDKIRRSEISLGAILAERDHIARAFCLARAHTYA